MIELAAPHNFFLKMPLRCQIITVMYNNSYLGRFSKTIVYYRGTLKDLKIALEDWREAPVVKSTFYRNVKQLSKMGWIKVSESDTGEIVWKYDTYVSDELYKLFTSNDDDQINRHDILL